MKNVNKSVKRTSSDICLLCKVNEASAKNSHIFPKFLTRNFLGKNRQAFTLSSKQIHKGQKITQDSPKEDHILCIDCERYFSILELISSDTFHNWKMRVARNEFVLDQEIEEVSVVDCVKTDKKIMRLLVYSMYWRSSISNHDVFTLGKMASEVEEDIRQTLLFYKRMTKAELLLTIEQNPSFKVFPFFIVTSNHFTDPTKNMVAVPNPYRLVVDQFSFQLFEDISQVPLEMFYVAMNGTLDDCKILVFSEPEWDKNVLKPMMDDLVQSQLKLLEQLPYSEKIKLFGKPPMSR